MTIRNRLFGQECSVSTRPQQESLGPFDVDDNNELEVDGDGDDAVGRLVPRLGDAEGHGQEGDRQTTVSFSD